MPRGPKKPKKEAKPKVDRLIDRDASGDVDVGELHIGLHLLGLEGVRVELGRALGAARYDMSRALARSVRRYLPREPIA